MKYHAKTIPLDEQLSYSLRRQYVDEYLKRTIKPTTPYESLLDLGGMKQRKRGKFDISTLGMQVCVVNISKMKQIDVRADAMVLPIQGHAFDWVLCSELLEHVKNPLIVIREVFRVLKTNGSLALTVPFLFRIHSDPLDVGRYTTWFWEQQLQEVGFKEIQIEKQGLFWSIAVDMMRDWLRYLVVSERVKSRILISIFPRLVRYFRNRVVALDSRPEIQDHEFFGRYVGGFGVLAVKR